MHPTCSLLLPFSLFVSTATIMAIVMKGHQEEEREEEEEKPAEVGHATESTKSTWPYSTLEFLLRVVLLNSTIAEPNREIPFRSRPQKGVLATCHRLRVAPMGTVYSANISVQLHTIEKDVLETGCPPPCDKSGKCDTWRPPLTLHPFLSKYLKTSPSLLRCTAFLPSRCL